MTRRCSHCSNNGHNSRTCPTRGGATGGNSGGGGGGVRLFGVRLTDGSFMKKSASMGNLSHYHSSNNSSASPNPSSPSTDPLQNDTVRVPDGYLSDDPNHASCSSNRRSERKKGKPWTEEEHRLFLIGLQKLGKGDWRGIARTYVVSRTPTQVASHAQKYFIRQSNATRRKRRSSLFDMVPDMVTKEPQTVPEEQALPPPVEPREADNANSLPSLDLSLSTEAEPMEATSTEEAKETGEPLPLPLSGNMAPPIPAFFLPVPYPPFWPQSTMQPEEDSKVETSQHQVLKPTPVLRKEPVNVDELVGMSRLKLSEAETFVPIKLVLIFPSSFDYLFHKMASRGVQICQVLLVLAIALTWSVGANAQSSSNSCTSVLLSMSSCLNYITGNSSNPASSCCSALSNVVQSQPQCLCAALNSGAASSLGVSINQTRALDLPNACNVQTPPVSRCNGAGGQSTAGAGAAPADSPAGVEGPAGDLPSGSKTVPSTTEGTSNGSIIDSSLLVAILFSVVSFTSARAIV